MTARRGSVAAVVLAGGRSTRFGANKLDHPLAGGTILAATVAAVAPVVDEVVVVLAPGAPEPTLPRLPLLRFARDPEPDAGPLVGLVAGLAAARAATVVVVGGDMPWVQPAVLSLLVAVLRRTRSTAVALQGGGEMRPLPAVLRRREALAGLRRVVAEGARSLRAGLAALAVAAVPEAAWRPLDPAGASLRDVDRPADLAGGDPSAGGLVVGTAPAVVSRASPGGSSRSSRRGDRGGA